MDIGKKGNEMVKEYLLISIRMYIQGNGRMAKNKVRERMYFSKLVWNTLASGEMDF